jgi:hypothetical protein
MSYHCCNNCTYLKTIRLNIFYSSSYSVTIIKEINHAECTATNKLEANPNLNKNPIIPYISYSWIKLMSKCGRNLLATACQFSPSNNFHCRRKGHLITSLWQRTPVWYNVETRLYSLNGAWHWTEASIRYELLTNDSYYIKTDDEVITVVVWCINQWTYCSPLQRNRIKLRRKPAVT